MKNKEKKNIKRSFEKFIYILGMVFFLTVFLACAIYLLKYLFENKKSENKVEDLRQLIKEDSSPNKTEDNNKNDIENEGNIDSYPEIEFVLVNGIEVQKKFEELYRLNNDFVGWISIEDTVIDYPVMYSSYDREYYLHRDFDKEYNGAGSIFIDTASSLNPESDNILVYGHNMKTGTMFHSLLDYEDEEFYNDHKFISFDTIYGNGTYEVIAAFRTSIYPSGYSGFKYYHFFNADNSYEFDEYVTNCKKLTPYNIETSAKYGDKLLSLSTCAYHSDNGRFVVVAKKISE